MRKVFAAICASLLLLSASGASAQEADSTSFDGTFLDTGFVIYDYTFGIPVFGIVQVNVGLEKTGDQWLWVPVKINPTLGINKLVSWIGSKVS